MIQPSIDMILKRFPRTWIESIILRQLILDGQWEDCLEFIQPLAQLHTFDFNLFNFLILKHKFVELLCIKSEIPIGSTESAVDEVVKVLKEIEVRISKIFWDCHFDKIMNLTDV